jgi:hypothetical protein
MRIAPAFFRDLRMKAERWDAVCILAISKRSGFNADSVSARKPVRGDREVMASTLRVTPDHVFMNHIFRGCSLLDQPVSTCSVFCRYRSSNYRAATYQATLN